MFCGDVDSTAPLYQGQGILGIKAQLGCQPLLQQLWSWQDESDTKQGMSQVSEPQTMTQLLHF